jgi:hypothetical protein
MGLRAIGVVAFLVFSSLELLCSGIGRRAAAIVALLYVTGCSFVVMDRAPKHDPGVRPVSCDTSRAAPIADTVIAGLATAAIGKIYYEDAQVPDSQKHGVASPLIVLVPLVLLPMILAHGGSAYAGYMAANRCERYRETPPPFQHAPPAPFAVTN